MISKAKSSVLSGADRKHNLMVRLGMTMGPHVDRVVARSSKIGDPAVFDPAAFPWISILEQEWLTVRREANVVLAANRVPALSDISRDHYRVAIDDRWRCFFLWGYGYRNDNNCARCPATARIVESIPGLTTALFSVLRPGAHIPRHTGATKTLITCHLPLIVPQDAQACRIAVSSRIYHWTIGRAFVFDDTREHEVWNDADETRVVLLIHFRRPLRYPGKLLGNVFLSAIRHSSFVQEARRNIEDWNKLADRL